MFGQADAPESRKDGTGDESSAEVVGLPSHRCVQGMCVCGMCVKEGVKMCPKRRTTTTTSWDAEKQK